MKLIEEIIKLFVELLFVIYLILGAILILGMMTFLNYLIK